MKRDDQKSLNNVLHLYWMSRVPELTEAEAIDHLEWELRSVGYIPKLENCKPTKATTKRLKKFLKDKGIKQ